MAARSPVFALLASLALMGAADAQTVVQTAHAPESASALPSPAREAAAPAPASEPAAPGDPSSPVSKPAETSVEAAPLASLDLFSPAGRNTGLGEDLWRGASAELARRVLPTLGRTSLEPGLAQLARRLTATGATAPDGAGSDADLAGERALALARLGDTDGARIMLSRTPGVSAHARLSQSAAESALWGGELDHACAIGEALADGRDGSFWLQLRAMCLTRQGKVSEAQLALDLAAQTPSHDADAQRLVNAMISGVAPGSASATTALAYAASRLLKLDLAPVMGDAALPALLALVADDQMSADVRRMAAFRLVISATEAGETVRRTLLLPTPDTPAAAETAAPAPPPVMHKGRKTGRAKPAPTPVIAKPSPAERLDAQAVALARLYAAARNGSDPAQRNAALLALLKSAHGPALRGLATLAAPEIALATADGQSQPDIYLLAVAAALTDAPNLQSLKDGLKTDAISDVSTVDLAALEAVQATVQADRPTAPALAHLAAATDKATPAARTRAENGAILLLALTDAKTAPDNETLTLLAGFAPRRASNATLVLLANAAADRHLRGQTGLVALSAVTGDGWSLGDRALFVRALQRAGLEAEARSIALDGLLPLTGR